MKLIKQLFDDQDGRCAYCEVAMALDLGRLDTATIDHRIPRSAGGNDDLSNLVAACFGCNTAKGSMSEAEFREYLAGGHPRLPLERGSVNDWAKVSVYDGTIHYFLYQQDGTRQPMTLPDTMHNRQCVSWFQIHDRM